MKKPILVDIDGVLADFISGYYQMAELHKYRFLKSVLPKKEDIRTFFIEDSIPEHLKTDEIKQQLHDIVNEVGLFVNLKMIENAQQGVQKLQQWSGRDVFFVSAPHNSAKMSYAEKAIWIENHFPSHWLDKLILCRDKTLISGCILIDDKPSPMGEFEPDWSHIVYDQPYNRHCIEVKGKRRMFSWIDEQIWSLVDYLKDKE